MNVLKWILKYRTIVIFILSIVVLSLILGYVANGESVIGASILVCNGIVTSLLSALIYSCAIEGQNDKILSDIKDEVVSSDKRIENMVKTIELYHNQILNNTALNKFGVLSIREKVCPENQGKYWIDLLASANNEFTVLGKTINTWFNKEYKNAFTEKIVQMAKSDKIIKIVLQGPTYNSSIKQKRLAKNKKMFDTYSNLVSIYSKIPDKNKHCLQVHLLPKNRNVCYAYIKTDRSCYVSTYMCDPKNEAKSFWIEFNKDSSFAGMFATDFNSMITEHNKIELGDIYDDIKKNSNK